MNGLQSRRRWITKGLAAAAGMSSVAVAARLATKYGLIPPDCGGRYGPGTTLTYASQRLLTRHSLAREFPRRKISKAPFANGKPPASDEFKRLQTAGFSEWRLSIDGMVAHPASFSVADLRGMPRRRQITQVTCEEGWCYVAEWIGVPLSHVLELAGIRPEARFVVYFSIGPDGWQDSIDMADALHPQTFLTYGMNDGDLPPEFGGPLRMRIPRQLAYKSVKYINRITVTDSLKQFAPGGDYSWYAGI